MESSHISRQDFRYHYPGKAALWTYSHDYLYSWQNLVPLDKSWYEANSLWGFFILLMGPGCPIEIIQLSFYCFFINRTLRWQLLYLATLKSLTTLSFKFHLGYWYGLFLMCNFIMSIFIMHIHYECKFIMCNFIMSVEVLGELSPFHNCHICNRCLCFMSVTHSFDSPYYHIDYKGFLFHVDSNKGISFLTEVHITFVNIGFLLCGFSGEYEVLKPQRSLQQWGCTHHIYRVSLPMGPLANAKFHTHKILTTHTTSVCFLSWMGMEGIMEKSGASGEALTVLIMWIWFLSHADSEDV